MRHKLISKAAMIEVAERLIKDEGLVKCSMRRISKEMGIASGTVYNYYPTRDALLQDVFVSSWQKTIDHANAIIDIQLSTLEKVQALFEVICEDVKNRNGLGKEILLVKESFAAEGSLNLKASLMAIIDRILRDEGFDEVRCGIVSKWLLLILFDAVIGDQTIDDLEWQMIASLVELPSK